MERISDVLDNQIRMHLDGLKTRDGMTTTQSQLQPSSQKTTDLTKQRSEECSEQRIPISKCLESKKNLTKLVTACFKAMNTYGATQEGLEASVMLMQMVLGKYPYSLVRKGFEIHMQNSSDMPKPADIIQIIDPPPAKKQWCKVTFLEIKRKKRENVFTTIQEDKYLEDFVKAAVSGDSDERAELGDALNQAQIEDKRYWLD